MKKFLLILLIAVPVFSGAGYALGLRFHPEALQKNFVYENRQFRQIHLKSGKTFVGEVLKETPDSVKITFAGGAVSFSRNEIAAMEPIDPQKAEYDEYADELVMLTQKPLFTFRREDSLFYVPPPPSAGAWAARLEALEKKNKSGKSGKKKMSGKPGEEEEEEGEDPALEKMGKVLEMVQKSQEMADQKRLENEKIVQEMQGGNS